MGGGESPWTPVGSGGTSANVGVEGVSERFDEAILAISLGGDGQMVTGLGTADQLGIQLQLLASVRCECLSKPPIP